MRVKILYESIQDVERYLRQIAVSDLEQEFGRRWYDESPSDIISYILSQVEERFNAVLSTPRVQLYQVYGSEVDLVTPDYLVIGYNGYYYDFNAMQNNELYSSQITVAKLPVTQPVIKSDAQIRENISSVKGYVMLGEVL